MAIITNNCWYDLITVFILTVMTIYYLIKKRLSYWQNLGISTLEPTVPFGNSLEIILQKKCFGEKFLEIYRKFKSEGHRHAGFYMGPTIIYVPIDIELVKRIMQIDFEHFHGHGGYINEEHDPLSVHLFNLDGLKWKNLRAKLTPTFTSGKMKMMFQTILDVSTNLQTALDKLIEKKEAIDIRDVLGRFGTDVISSIAFGLECDSLKDPNIPFRVYGKKAVEFNIGQFIKLFKQLLLPDSVLNLIKHKFTNPEVEKFFMKVIEDTVNYREQNKIYRKDFMHLLLQLKNLGTVTDDDRIVDETGQSKEVGLNLKQLAAQAYIFFMAGYETSSTTLTFALYELASNFDIQDQLREEIQMIYNKHGGKLTYDGIMQMTYMDKVLNETLRKYPPLPVLMRECTKNYTIPNTSIEIKKGTGVLIPVLGIHRDEEFYPNADLFDPERFSDENKHTRPSCTWLPFGDGPRLCIGMRFGILQNKIALTAIIKNYKVTINERTHTPIQFSKKDFILRTQGDVWLNLSKL